MMMVSHCVWLRVMEQKEQIDVLVAELDRLKPAHAASAAQPPLYLEDGSQQQSKEQECDADATAREGEGHAPC